ncbi:hypothetical protein WICPIJ_004092 [Wickerhamomyces pijperi]|uniref:Uncharacterized protein n=1 Tax=Wickerhamomyces pijperi TaxID=599730 RepID=A0A9P8Q6K9_WICPI|nr:hypothetical protein WICPIJ_004092 [Wickerhamomyces pijperi]
MSRKKETQSNANNHEPLRMERRDSILIHPPIPPGHQSQRVLPPINVIQSTPTEEFNPHLTTSARTPAVASNQLEALTPFPSSLNNNNNNTSKSGSQLNLTRTNTKAYHSNSISHSHANINLNQSLNQFHHTQPSSSSHYRTNSTTNLLHNHPLTKTQTQTSQSELSSTYSQSLRTTATTTANVPPSYFKRTSSTNILNDTIPSSQANQRFNDQFASVKPLSQKQEYQQADLLWSQIDTLDDVRNFAEESRVSFMKSLQNEEADNNNAHDSENELEQNETGITSNQAEQVSDPRTTYLRTVKELRDAQNSLIMEIRKNSALINEDLKQFKQTNWRNSEQSDMRENTNGIGMNRPSIHNPEAEAEHRQRIKKLSLAREHFIKGQVSVGLKDIESKLENVSLSLRKVWEARRSEEDEEYL